MTRSKTSLQLSALGLFALLVACVDSNGNSSVAGESEDGATGDSAGSASDSAAGEAESAPAAASAVIWARDEYGEPIENVRITLHGDATPVGRSPVPTYVTDRLGRARLERLAPGELIAELRAPGYTPTTVRLDLHAGARPIVHARLLRLEGHVHGFHTELGAVIDDGPVHLEIPPYALVYEETGEPVAGFVRATVVPFDPARYSPEDVPGRLRGTARDGDDALLTSLMMAEVSLWEGTRPLQLVEGAQARLSMTLPESVLIGKDIPEAGPGAIPFWWLDQERGRWIEVPHEVELEAAGDGRLTWSVALDHFTWFNLDIPKEEIKCVSGVLVDEDDDTPLANVIVYVIINGVPWDWFETDGDGEFCVDLPQGVTFDLDVQNSPDVFENLVADGPAGTCDGFGEGCKDLGKLEAELFGCALGEELSCDYEQPNPEDFEDGHPCLNGVQVCDENGDWGECELGFDYECGNLDLDCDHEEDIEDPLCELDDCEGLLEEEVECYTGQPGTYHPELGGDQMYCKPGLFKCVNDKIKCEGGESQPDLNNCVNEMAEDPPVDYNCNGVIDEPEDCQGNGMWMHKLHATDKLTVSSIDFDGGGGLFVVGTFEGELYFAHEFQAESVDDAPNDFHEELFVLKLNVAGELIWSRTFPGSFEWARPHTTVDELGNLYIAAMTGDEMLQNAVVYGLDGFSGDVLKEQVLGSPGTVDGDIAIVSVDPGVLLVAGTLGTDSAVTIVDSPAPQGDDLFFVEVHSEYSMVIDGPHVVNASGTQIVAGLDRVGDSVLVTGYFDKPFTLNGQAVAGGDQNRPDNLFIGAYEGGALTEPIVLRAGGMAFVPPTVSLSANPNNAEFLVGGHFQGSLKHQGQQVSPGGSFALMFNSAGAITWTAKDVGFSPTFLPGAGINTFGDLVFVGAGPSSACETVNGSGGFYVHRRDLQSCDWERRFGPQPDFLNRMEDLAIDAAGRIYVVGNTSGTIDIGGPIEPVVGGALEKTAFVAGFLP